MKYGYCRVSSDSQNLDRQIAAMLEAGITEENLFMDKKSGKDFDRIEYKKLLDTIQEGDIIYILSIDRLGRNYEEILANWRIITSDIKADIVVLDMPLLDTSKGGNDLTGRFVADLVLQILSYVAQKERESIRARQQYGIEKRREQDGYRQMKATDEEFFEVKRLVDEGKIAVSTACARLGLKSRKSWYNRLEIYKRDGKLQGVCAVNEFYAPVEVT